MSAYKEASESPSLEKGSPEVTVRESRNHIDNDSQLSVRHADDALLAELGYKSEFRREFSVNSRVLFTAPDIDSAIVCLFSLSRLSRSRSL